MTLGIDVVLSGAAEESTAGERAALVPELEEDERLLRKSKPRSRR
jgi:hypothetical protein